MSPIVVSILVISTISIYTVVLGITYPFLSLNLHEIGISSDLIGLNASMVPIGLLLSSISYRRVLQYFSPYKFVTRSIQCSILIMILIFIAQEFIGTITLLYVWLPLCIALGFSINGLFIVGEAWLNKLSPPKFRGRLLSTYTTMLIIGYGIGPFFISLLSHDGFPLYFVSITFLLMSLIPLFMIKKHLLIIDFGSFENQKVSGGGDNHISFIFHNFIIVICFASIALFDNTSISFMPIYFLDRSYGHDQANLLLALMIFGGAALQPLVGIIADHIHNKVVISLSSILTIIFSLYFYTSETTTYDYFIVVIWGGVAFVNYTMALKELGDRYSDSRLILGSAVLAMTWALVTIFGLPLSGIIMRWTSVSAFPFIIVSLYLFVIISSVMTGKTAASSSRSSGDSMN